MKMRHNGKVHPSPLEREVHQVLSLLPKYMLVLIAVLSVQDKEALAYMITRAMNLSVLDQENNKKKTQKPHRFNCSCFTCYKYYWDQWNCSEHREVIHQAIDAFEESLWVSEKQKNAKRGKKKDKQRKSVKGWEKVELLEVGLVGNGVPEVAGGSDVAAPSTVRKMFREVIRVIISRLFG